MGFKLRFRLLYSTTLILAFFPALGQTPAKPALTLVEPPTPLLPRPTLLARTTATVRAACQALRMAAGVGCRAVSSESASRLSR